MPAPLPLRRADAAQALARTTEVDVLVVGAGTTGAGVALDAAARGARVALIDRGDLAAGTSSRSSKLIHGGARYLATGDVAMVAEGVRERDRLRRLAPHLVRPLPFTIPTDSRAELALLRAGMVAYDTLAFGRGVGRHRRLRPTGVLRDAPGLATGFAAGGVRYLDARTDDARLTLEVARTAVALGALVVPHVELTGLRRRAGRVVGAELRDAVSGQEHAIGARWVVAAGGVWADAIGRDPLGTGAEDELALAPARGSHLTFERSALPVRTAVVIPSTTGDGRRLFVVPWGEQVYVGTTDDAHETGTEDVTVTAQDATTLLDAVNTAFGTRLTVADAVGAWAGLRPLLGAGAGASTADLSRRHAVVEPAPGLVRVTGGKLTTYRAMAADVVDHLAADVGLRARSPTTHLPLGPPDPGGLDGARRTTVAHGLEPWLADGLHHRHGGALDEVLALAAEHDELDRLTDGLPYLVGEVRAAARRELATTLDDVLSRRLRVSLRDRAAGGPGIAVAADVLADELGWDPVERDRQVATYLDAVATERGVVGLAR